MNAAITIETRLRATWAELLGTATEDISFDSNFFGLGGNSLLVLSLHISLCLEFSISITLAELFANADFGHMVLLVRNKQGEFRQGALGEPR